MTSRQRTVPPVIATALHGLRAAVRRTRIGDSITLEVACAQRVEDAWWDWVLVAQPSDGSAEPKQIAGPWLGSRRTAQVLDGIAEGIKLATRLAILFEPKNGGDEGGGDGVTCSAP